MTFIIRNRSNPTRYLARRPYGPLYTNDPELAEQFPSATAAEMVLLPNEVVVDVSSFVAEESAACATLQNLYETSQNQSNPPQPSPTP